jgi:hypothetical protein
MKWVYLLSRFLLDLRLLEESIHSKEKSNISKHTKQAGKTKKEVLLNIKRFAGLRSYAYTLAGRYCWLLGKQNKALKYWKKAIEEGERLGLRPELARAYMELGSRFLEERNS